MIELIRKRREEAKKEEKLLHTETLFNELVIKNSYRPPVINAGLNFINSILLILRSPDFYASMVASKIVERVI